MYQFESHLVYSLLFEPLAVYRGGGPAGGPYVKFAMIIIWMDELGSQLQSSALLSSYFIEYSKKYKCKATLLLLFRMQLVY